MRQIFLILILFVLLEPVYSRTACVNYFFYQLENPLQLDTFLKKRNISSEMLTVERGSSNFKVFYNKRLLLEFGLFENFIGIVYPYTHQIKFEQKKGLGLISYLLLARDLYLNQGRLLGSDVSLSDSAIMLWQRLVFLGFAEDHGYYYQFKESSMQESKNWKEFDEILKKSFHPNSFFDRIYKRIFSF